MNKFFNKNSDKFYFAFRLIVGLLFFLHGFSKIAGIQSGKISLISLIGLAMAIELVVGLLIIIGLYVRPAALIGGIQMLYVFIFVHVAPKLLSTGSFEGFNINPLVNKGELALLFLTAFLVLMAFGARKWAFDK